MINNLEYYNIKAKEVFYKSKIEEYINKYSIKEKISKSEAKKVIMRDFKTAKDYEYDPIKMAAAIRNLRVSYINIRTMYKGYYGW